MNQIAAVACLQNKIIFILQKKTIYYFHSSVHIQSVSYHKRLDLQSFMLDIRWVNVGLVGLISVLLSKRLIP